MFASGCLISESEFVAVLRDARELCSRAPQDEGRCLLRFSNFGLILRSVTVGHASRRMAAHVIYDKKTSSMRRTSSMRVRGASERPRSCRNPIWSERRSPPMPMMRVSVVVAVVIVAQVIRRGSAPCVGLVADPDRMRARPEFLLLVQRGDGIAGEGNRVSARGCGQE